MGEDDPKPPKSHGRLSIGASLTPRDLVTPTPQLAGVWTARIVTLFPEAFPGTLGLSLTGKALQEGKWQIQPLDLRGFGVGKHRNVDDTPAGGGTTKSLAAGPGNPSATGSESRESVGATGSKSKQRALCRSCCACCHLSV